MNKTHGKEGSEQAIKLIEAQLYALAVSITLLSQSPLSGSIESNVAAAFSTLKSKRRPHDTGSGGNIVTDDSQGDVAPSFSTYDGTQHHSPFLENDYLRTVISNALLVVRLFLIQHEMGDMRTPEIQFLGHVCNAILNENAFDIKPGYIPIATFDGLIVDSGLSGTPLFRDGINEGFMEFGDAIALLQWLSRFLGGEMHFVSDGDAG